MDLKDIYKELEKDFSFFKDYKEKFKENFKESFLRIYPDRSSPPLLNTLVSRLYAALFSMRADPRKELYNLCLALLRNKMDFRPVLIEVCLQMTKDYIDFIVKSLSPYKRIKVFLDLVDIYVQTAERANRDYIRYVEGELKKKEKEAEDKGKQLAIALLKALIESGSKKVIVHTVYRGLMVDTDSELIRLDGENVLIKTKNMKVYTSGDRVYLKGSALPSEIICRIKEVDREKGFLWASVEGFRDIPEERRRYVRVVPDKDIPVKLKKGGKVHVGIMADLCVRGVGVYLEKPEGLNKGDRLKVDFDLPEGTVEVEGEIRHISPHANIFRVGIYFEPDLATEDIVSGYIMKRQLAILREIREIY